MVDWHYQKWLLVQLAAANGGNKLTVKTVVPAVGLTVIAATDDLVDQVVFAWSGLEEVVGYAFLPYSASVGETFEAAWQLRPALEHFGVLEMLGTFDSSAETQRLVVENSLFL